MGIGGRLDKAQQQLKSGGQAHIIWVENQTREAALAAFKANRPKLIIEDRDTIHYVSFLDSHEQSEKDQNVQLESALHEESTGTG